MATVSPLALTAPRYPPAASPMAATFSASSWAAAARAAVSAAVSGFPVSGSITEARWVSRVRLAVRITLRLSSAGRLFPPPAPEEPLPEPDPVSADAAPAEGPAEPAAADDIAWAVSPPATALVAAAVVAAALVIDAELPAEVHPAISTTPAVTSPPIAGRIRRARRPPGTRGVLRAPVTRTFAIADLPS